MKSTIEKDIRILKGGWTIASSDDDSKHVKRLSVELAIEGNAKKGYHLIMTPDGQSAADFHFDTTEDAKEGAEEYFEVSNIQWS